MSKIRVMLADDHGILREGLRLLLQSQLDIDVVGEARDGVEAMELARSLRPDVLLIDIAMPRMNGLETLTLLRDACPQIRTVVLSGFEKEAYVHQALKAGAAGYVVKGAPGEELLAAVRAAAGGKTFLSDQVQKGVIQGYIDGRPDQPGPAGFDELSEREQQVFRLLVEGNTGSQIAEILFISSKTVDKHRAAIARKTGLDNPVKMVQYAIRTGLVDPKRWEE